MSNENTKKLIINLKDLSFRSEQLVLDLIRYLTEQLPQLQITRNGNELEIATPKQLSNRAVKLRIKKFLYKKNLTGDFRPISLIDPNKEGYLIKEKKGLQLAYY